MGQISDEVLMAYADGELPPQEKEALEALLSRDATLRMRLAPFVVTRREIAGVFDATLDEPVPERLVDAILRAPVPPNRRPAASSGIESWLKRTRDVISAAVFPQGASLATAASLALMLSVGALAGWLAAQSGPRETSGLIASSGSSLTAAGALAQALEKAPSGTQALTGKLGSAVIPILSFRRAEGDGICREYQIRNATDEPDYAGLACRDAEGAWHVAVHVETSKPATAQLETGENYQTAGGPTARAVDAVADALIAGDALGQDEERALLENGWRPASS